PHLAVRRDALRQRAREVAAAGSDVEDALAGTRPGDADGERLPDAMQAERHEVVHHVVALGNRIEDLADPARLVAFGNALVAEIRVLTHGSLRRPSAFRDTPSRACPGSGRARKGSPRNRCRWHGRPRTAAGPRTSPPLPSNGSRPTACRSAALPGPDRGRAPRPRANRRAGIRTAGGRSCRRRRRSPSPATSDG